VRRFATRSCHFPYRRRMRRFASALAVSAALLAPPSAAARPLGGLGGSEGEKVRATAFRASGATTQGETLTLTISNAVTRVSRFRIGWRARCPSGRLVDEGSVVAPMPIRASRSGLVFRSSGTCTFPLGGGSTARVQANLFGRIVKRINLRGTWSATYSVLTADGQPVETCSTGLVRWRGNVH
jgi:hypothetical protein